MEWRRDENEDETVWTRRDDTAVVRLRRTTTGTWAVTLDRLRQAPDGETYEHETFDDRAAAERQAEQWRTDP